MVVGWAQDGKRKRRVSDLKPRLPDTEKIVVALRRLAEY